MKVTIKNLVYIVVAVTTVFWSCGGNTTTKAIKGDAFYGGTFKINEISSFKSLYPLNVTEVTSFRIASQVYEGLVKLDQKDLSVLPSLAESWQTNNNATSFIFHLKKDVFFHNNACFKNGEGREVTAYDFKYCYDKICEQASNNQMFWLFQDKVIGANEYYESTINKTPLENGVEGISVIDDYTLRIDLKYPFAGFLNMLSHSACWIYPKEAFDTYGDEMRVNCVGTGAFRVKTIKESETVVLEKNPNYWRVDKYGNQLPYLDEINFSFIKEKKAELFEFKKGNLDMIFRLPTEMIKDVVGELEDAKKGGNKPFTMQIVPAMSVFYYGFQHKLPPFNNLDVRKAFNYAIDRKSIITYTLQGDGNLGIHGIVPPFEGYEQDSVKGYEYSPEKARNHMHKAGFPNGEGFPEITLQINSGGGDRNIQTAEAIKEMLQENLGVKLKIEVMPFTQHLENIKKGNALFWKSGWVADYPDPENFLSLLYGRSVPKDLGTESFINSTRYQSPIFDSLYNEGLREVDENKRFELFKQADQVAMDDAAIMPIFYEENTRLLQPSVRNFPANAMEYRDLSEVYFDYEEGK